MQKIFLLLLMFLCSCTSNLENTRTEGQQKTRTEGFGNSLMEQMNQSTGIRSSNIPNSQVGF